MSCYHKGSGIDDSLLFFFLLLLLIFCQSGSIFGCGCEAETTCC